MAALGVIVHHKTLESTLEIFVFNVLGVLNSQGFNFEMVLNGGAHRGSVSSFDLCRTKSVALTLGEDQQVKLWRISGGFSEIFSQHFNEALLAVSLHPLGMLCAMGFKDGYLLY